MYPAGNKVALVTGASRGIGRAIAFALGQAGCFTLVNYRTRQADAESTLAGIQRDGGRGELCPFDVADAVATEKAIAAIFEKHQHIDVLINNAGIRHDGLLVFMQPEQWTQVINTNLNSFFNVTKPVVKQMALNRWGRIVSIASTAGQTGVEGQANYSAAKAGLIGASRSLAREAVLAQIPAARFGKPEEVAAAAAFLCSEAAGYITGAVLNVNGGVYT